MCIRIMDSSNAYVYSYAVKVDKLTVLELTNIASFINTNENMTLSIEMNNITSPDIVYFGPIQIIQDVTNGYYTNPVNIVIRTTTGYMDTIYNDYQDCSSCALAASK